MNTRFDVLMWAHRVAARKKGTPAHVVLELRADATLEDAAVLMRTGRHPVLPVVDAGRFVGLLPWTAVLP